MTEDKKKLPSKVSVYLEPSTKADVATLAKAKGLSVSSLIKTLLADAVREAKQDGLIAA